MAKDKMRKNNKTAELSNLGTYDIAVGDQEGRHLTYSKWGRKCMNAKEVARGGGCEYCCQLSQFVQDVLMFWGSMTHSIESVCEDTKCPAFSIWQNSTKILRI